MNNENFSMDKILNGYGKEYLNSYFGTPRLDYPTLSVFDREKGILVALFQNMKASAYVLYNLEGQLVRAVNVTPVTIDIPRENDVITLEDFVKKYGNPPIDFGSGRSVPAYLGTDAKLYRLMIIGNKIKKILEISLIPKTKN